MKLIQHIKQLLVTGEFTAPLAGAAMNNMPFLENAYLLIKDGLIYDYGSMNELQPIAVDEVVDASGAIILPSWVDSHTHLVFAAGREQEFEDRITGLTYEEIASRGGGILNSVEALRNMPFDQLYQESAVKLQRLIELGTGAIEIKSGYGLSFEAEEKILQVIAKLQANFDIPIRATLLAAHAIPKEYTTNRQGYIDLIINQMIPAFTKTKSCTFIDVFCEKGYFTLEETRQLLEAGKKHGLTPKVHLNQFNALGGIALAVELNALTVDHLEILTEDDLNALATSKTLPVGLPGCSFFLHLPYTPARKIIDAGLPFVIASDFNPGSAPSGNMNFVVSQGCINLNMSPQEAIVAATINAAFAIQLENEVGSISKGKKANLLWMEGLKGYQGIPYYYGDSAIKKILVNGEFLHATQF